MVAGACFAIYFLNIMTTKADSVDSRKYSSRNDENAKIISKNNEKITFLDFEIYYKDVDNFVSTAREYLPEKPSVMYLEKQHNVVHYKCI